MPYEESYGARIRQFIQELFGSRLTAHLESEILRLRNDHDRALHDRDIQISTLKEEKQLLQSKITAYEFAVLPRTSRAGAEVIAYQKPALSKPNFSFADIGQTKSKWEVFQENYYKEEAAKEAAEKSQKEAAPAAV
jgi:hypothetical protein